MKRGLVGLLMIALLGGVSQGCAIGVAALVGGAAAEGWFLGKSSVEKPAEPKQEAKDVPKAAH